MAALFAEDRALVRRLLSGDEAAFAEFFDRQAPRLYRFALSRLGHDCDAAEEVVQMTLLRVFTKLPTYRGEAPLFSWLCTFCRHEIGRWCALSQRAVRQRALLQDTDELRGVLDLLGAEPTIDPERGLLRRELAQLVQTTLDCLPGRYGEILEWKYIDGLSVKEIAGRLATTPAAVQSMLARARLAFQRGFGPLAPVLAALPPSRLQDG